MNNQKNNTIILAEKISMVANNGTPRIIGINNLSELEIINFNLLQRSFETQLIDGTECDGIAYYRTDYDVMPYSVTMSYSFKEDDDPLVIDIRIISIKAPDYVDWGTKEDDNDEKDCVYDDYDIE
jgi:hypothetical protein